MGNLLTSCKQILCIFSVAAAVFAHQKIRCAPPQKHLDKCPNSSYNINVVCRGVAQFGRALRSGRRGRGFESRRLDQKRNDNFQ